MSPVHEARAKKLFRKLLATLTKRGHKISPHEDKERDEFFGRKKRVVPGAADLNIDGVFVKIDFDTRGWREDAKFRMEARSGTFYHHKQTVIERKKHKDGFDMNEVAYAIEQWLIIEKRRLKERDEDHRVRKANMAAVKRVKERLCEPSAIRVGAGHRNARGMIDVSLTLDSIPEARAHEVVRGLQDLLGEPAKALQHQVMTNQDT